MRAAAAALVAVLALAATGCRKTSDRDSPDALLKALASADAGERARAAEKLHEIYARDRSILGDHGETYWKTQLTLARTDKAAREQVSALEELPRNEGPGNPKTKDVRLDPFWIAELRYDPEYAGYEKIERKVKAVRVTPPPRFYGTWKTYYVNGALDSSTKYTADHREEIREYYDDGTLREERLYTSDTQVPVGPLVHYYPTGRKAYEQPYTNGKMHGVSRAWYPSGQLEHEWPYAEGKREGTWRDFHPNGDLDLCVEYHADVEVSRGCK